MFNKGDKVYCVYAYGSWENLRRDTIYIVTDISYNQGMKFLWLNADDSCGYHSANFVKVIGEIKDEVL